MGLRYGFVVERVQMTVLRVLEIEIKQDVGLLVESKLFHVDPTEVTSMFRVLNSDVEASLREG